MKLKLTDDQAALLEDMMLDSYFGLPGPTRWPEELNPVLEDLQDKIYGEES